MAATHVNEVRNREFVQDNVACTITVASAGNAVCGVVWWKSAASETLVSITGFTLVGSTQTGGGWSSRGFYKENCSAGSLTATAVVSGAVDDIVMALHEADGVATSSALDNHSSNYQGFPGTPTTDFINSGSVTVQDGSYMAGFTRAVFASFASAGTGWTAELTNSLTMSTESRIKSGTGSISATFTAGDNDGYHTWLIALLVEGGGGGPASAIAAIVHHRKQQGIQ